jgi:peptidyl-prolyl cis-trans isomerase SurA
MDERRDATHMRHALASIRRVAICALLILMGTGGPMRAEIINRIVATVDGNPITYYELRQYAATDIQARQAGVTDPASLLELLITTRLIALEIKANGIVIGDADIDNYIKQVRLQNQLSEEQLWAALAQEGMTQELYRAQIRDEMERAQLINREIRGKVNVTPEEVERYYQANLSEYEKAPEISVSQIMLRLSADAPPIEADRVIQRAQQIHAELDDGGSFEELARKYSEGPAADSGGQLGTFKQGSLLDALNDATEDLKPGQYSEPVRSEVGVHIVRLDDRSTDTHQPLEDQAEAIKDRLYAEALEERYKRWLTEDLRERHHVDFLE